VSYRAPLTTRVELYFLISCLKLYRINKRKNRLK